MFFKHKLQALKKIVSSVLAFAIVLSFFNVPVLPASTAHAAAGDNSNLLGIVVNKPIHAAVDLDPATIDIALPYGTLYQMLNVTTNPGAVAALYRSNGTTAIAFATSGINKGDAKLDQFSASGSTLYYLTVTDKNNSSNSKTYTITVTVDTALPPVTGPMGANDKYLPLNIKSGEYAWDVMGASKIGNGSTTGSVEGPGTPSSYSGKAWSESVYDRSGDYPLASTVNESWLGDNMYLQTIGKNDSNALAKYGIANIQGTGKLNSDILRFHEFDPFVTPSGVSRDDGDRGAVGSDRQRLEIKSNTSASNMDANSVGGDIMTNHWRLMLPSETLRYQKDVGNKHAGDFIVPRKFWHIFQMKEVAGNAAGQPVATLSLVSSGGKGALEFRNNPDGSYADRIKRLFTIPFEKIVDRWLDFEVTILTADNGYIYGKLMDLETGEVLFEGGMTAETYRRPEVKNPVTGRDERTDLPVESGQQNRSKWGLYRGMYNGAGDAAYADEFQNATMYLSDVYLIKRDKDSYIFPDGWNPNAQPKNVVAWARPAAITASKGTAFSSLVLPSQLDVTFSTGNTEKVNVNWSSDGYNPDSTGTVKIYGDFNSEGITNTKNIRPYIEVTLSDYKNWAVAPGAGIKVVSTGSNKTSFIDDNSSTYWQANSSLVTPDAGNHQYWAAVQLEKKIDVGKIQIEWTNNSSYLKNYQVYYTNNAAAYNELVEGNNFSTSSNGTEKPLLTASGASWIPIPGVGQTTPLANNQKVDKTLTVPVDAQYLLLVSDVDQRQPSGSGVGIRSNVFRVFGEPSGSKARLENLKLDGTTIPNFAPSQTSYTYTLSRDASTLPNVEAVAPAGLGVNIVYPADYRSEPVTVTVYDPLGAIAENMYKINFISPYAADPLVLPGNTANYAYSDARFSNSVATGLVTDIPTVTTYRQFSPLPNIGDWFSLTMKDVPSGTYKVEVGYKDGTNRGAGQLSVDGVNVGEPIVEYRASTSGVFQLAQVGEFTLDSNGDHTFKFTVVASGGSSSTNTAFTVAYIRLIPVVEDFILVNSLTLGKNSLSLAAGQTESLQAVVLPEEANNKTVTWKSDNPSVATVDGSGVVTGISKGTAVITATIGRLSQTCTVTVTDAPPAATSVNLLAPSRFTPQAGVNLKVSSEASDHPGVDALKSGGSGYWRNSSSNIYMSDYSPSSLALTLDLGAPKTIDKLYLELPNTISNIQSNATRFEVYYSNSADSWASAPTASDTVYNYDWKANGWTLAGGTETEGLWSYVTYNGQKWGYDTKTFLYPFTARYVMINTVLVGPRDRRANDSNAMMGISGLAIYGKDPVSNATALVPAKGTYSTWDQAAPVTTKMNLAGGQTLTSITKGDITLRPNTDYSLSDSTVTFAPAYLAKLPLGTNEFAFHFSSGAPSIFALDVTARGYGENNKTIKMNAIEGVSPYNVLGGAMGTDEPVEGVTKRIRDAYHAFYGDQPRATAADDHITSVWDGTLQKNVFQIMEYGRGVNNEYLDKVRDG